MVFFWVSVGSTLELSPARCTASKSPESATLTLRSFIEWTSPSRVIRTSRVSAFPYWFGPRTNFIPARRPAGAASSAFLRVLVVWVDERVLIAGRVEVVQLGTVD